MDTAQVIHPAVAGRLATLWAYYALRAAPQGAGASLTSLRFVDAAGRARRHEHRTVLTRGRSKRQADGNVVSSFGDAIAGSGVWGFALCSSVARTGCDAGGGRTISPIPAGNLGFQLPDQRLSLCAGSARDADISCFPQVAPADGVARREKRNRHDIKTKLRIVVLWTDFNQLMHVAENSGEPRSISTARTFYRACSFALLITTRSLAILASRSAGVSWSSDGGCTGSSGKYGAGSTPI